MTWLSVHEKRRERPRGIFALAGDLLTCRTCYHPAYRFIQDVRLVDFIRKPPVERMNGEEVGLDEEYKCSHCGAKIDGQLRKGILDLFHVSTEGSPKG